MTSKPNTIIKEREKEEGYRERVCEYSGLLRVEEYERMEEGTEIDKKVREREIKGDSTSI